MADLQLKRGTTLKHSTFTGKVGETTIDTDKDTLVVHDGSTVGGFPLARESQVLAHTSATGNVHGVTFAQVNEKPTTLSGYGITDAYTKTEIDTITNNLDALPSQTGFAGKYLKTDGTVATWESASASTGTGLSTFDFVATAGQTTFSIVYVPGNIDVHHNGLLLSKGDYIATNGASVVLNTGATVGDVISITVYDTFDVANTYTKGEIDLVIGNINAALDIINGEIA